MNGPLLSKMLRAIASVGHGEAIRARSASSLPVSRFGLAGNMVGEMAHH